MGQLYTYDFKYFRYLSDKLEDMEFKSEEEAWKEARRLLNHKYKAETLSQKGDGLSYKKADLELKKMKKS